MLVLQRGQRMSEITEITITATYKGERVELISYGLAAQQLGCTRQNVHRRVKEQGIGNSQLPGNQRSRLLVRREWEEGIRKNRTAKKESK